MFTARRRKYLQGRRAGGTAASPTALGSGLTISGVTGGGYDGTAGSTNAAGAYNITSGGILGQLPRIRHFIDFILLR